MNRRGQNVIEYILLAVAVVAVCIVVLAKNGPFAQKVNDVMKLPMNGLQIMNSAVGFHHQN